MKTVILDGSALSDMEAVHTVFAEALGFPAWYGRNLDALYDCLTSLPEPVIVQLCNVEELGETLGRRYDALLRLLGDAAAAGSIQVEVSDEL